MRTSPMSFGLIAALVVLTGAFACQKSNDSGSTAQSTPVASNAPVSNSSPAAASAPKDIAGNYKASGKNADGGGLYEAALVVTKRDDVFQFSWDSAGRKYDGVGVVVDDRVAVSYADGTDGKGCGVVLYKIASDGVLDGVAGYWGTNTRETEKASRKSGTDLEGEYEASGTNTTGNSYKAQLKVSKSGEGYTFKWGGGNPLEGFGVRDGDYLSVVFGPRTCGFVAYSIKPDGSLSGRWGSAASTSLGTENAKKN